MNIFVAIDAQQIFVWLQRIVYLHLWPLAVSSKRPLRSIGLCQNHDEVVDAHQAPFHLRGRLRESR